MKVTLQEQEYASVPTEGKWFRVNPLAIDQNLFKEKREDLMQDKTRKLILQAFKELKKHPERNKAFKTLIPEKTWEVETVGGLKKMASQLGDHIADWVEQALEWAQRIENGESWEALCNKADTANWYRLVVWKEGYPQCVGGLREDSDFSMPSVALDDDAYADYDFSFLAVPLVVAYDD